MIDVNEMMLALCIWREARGESTDGRIGVGSVILNRLKSGVKWWGSSVIDIIICPWQFSSFNPSDPNAKKWPKTKDTTWEECCVLACGLLNNAIVDNVDGATLYYDSSLDNDPPKWAVKSMHVKNIGRLRFYK